MRSGGGCHFLGGREIVEREQGAGADRGCITVVCIDKHVVKQGRQQSLRQAHVCFLGGMRHRKWWGGGHWWGGRCGRPPPSPMLVLTVPHPPSLCARSNPHPPPFSQHTPTHPLPVVPPPRPPIGDAQQAACQGGGHFQGRAGEHRSTSGGEPAATHLRWGGGGSRWGRGCLWVRGAPHSTCGCASIVHGWVGGWVGACVRPKGRGGACMCCLGGHDVCGTNLSGHPQHITTTTWSCSTSTAQHSTEHPPQQKQPTAPLCPPLPLSAPPPPWSHRTSMQRVLSAAWCRGPASSSDARSDAHPASG